QIPERDDPIDDLNNAIETLAAVEAQAPAVRPDETTEILREVRDLLTRMSQGSSPSVAPKQYKVLTQKDKWFSAKFDPERLEQAINAYANQGWVVKSVTTASFPGFVGGNRDEMIVVLER